MRPAPLPTLLGLAAALLITLGIVGAGTVLADDEHPPSGEEPFRTTPLADLDASTVVVQRAAFCDEVDPRQVEAALEAEPAREGEWENGDRIELPNGERDVVHEFGCEYAAADGATASGWVYAPPVEVRRARRLARVEGRVGSSCTGTRDSAPYGHPSSMLSCIRQDTYLVAYQGLFGDAWLTCELSVRVRADGEPLDLDHLEDRAGRWCVGVVLAAS